MVHRLTIVGAKIKIVIESILNKLGTLRNLITNASWVFSAEVIISGIAFVQTIIVARFLGVEQYGFLALITAYGEMINKIMDFKVWEAATKYLSEFLVREDKPGTLAIVKLSYLVDFCTGVAAFIIAVLCAPLMATYILHLPEATNSISLYAFCLLAATVNETSMAILRVFNRFSWISLQSIIFTLIRFGFVVGFIALGGGLREVLIAYILSELIGAVVLGILSLNTVKSRLGFGEWANARLSLLRRRWKEMAFFLINTNLSSLSGLALSSFTTMCLGYFRNPTEAGYYKMANNIIGLIGRIISPINVAIYPELAKLWASDNRSGFIRLIRQVAKLASFIVIPSSVLFFVFAPWIIDHLAGHEYLPSVQAARIMVWSVISMGLLVWLRPSHLAMGRAWAPTLATWTTAIFVVPLSLILVPSLGYIGSAWIYLFQDFFGRGFSGILYWRGILDKKPPITIELIVKSPRD